MADNDSYEKDMEEIFGETRGERERKRLKQISDAAAESVRLANDFKQELKKEEIQSDDPIIQKCLDIIRNKNVIVKDLSGKEFYRVYIGDKCQFEVHKYDGFNVYEVTIDFDSRYFNKKRPDLEELYRLCVAKYNEQALKKEEKTGRKPLTSGQRTGILFMSWGLFIIAIGIIDYVDFKKTQRVKKQVEAFEKTLPAEYLEYKQAVEHYRDSLMHSKGR